MQTKDLIMENINSIMRKATCSKGFSCVKNDFKNICNAKLNNVNEVICLEAEDDKCEHKNFTESNVMCNCSLRRIIMEIKI